MSTNQNASSSIVSSLHKLPKWCSKEARAKKEAYVHENIARLRPSSSKVAEKARRCSHGNVPTLECGDCFAESVRGLPSLPLSLVLKKLSTTDFFLVGGRRSACHRPYLFQESKVRRTSPHSLCKEVGSHHHLGNRILCA